MAQRYLLTASNIQDPNAVLSERELRYGKPYYSPRTTKCRAIDVLLENDVRPIFLKRSPILPADIFGKKKTSPFQGL